MKCKVCGGNIGLQDKVCPYCGAPIESVMKHKEDMERYEQEFRKTKSAVYEETEKVKRFSGKIIIIAVLIVLNLIAVFVMTNSYNIVSAFDKMRINSKADTYKADIDTLLEQGDYAGAYEYYEANDLYMSDAMRGYSCVMDTANTYTQMEYAINSMIRDANLEQTDEDAYSWKKSIALQIEGYFSASGSTYYYSEERYQASQQPYLDDMVQQLEYMLKTYCHIQDGDWESFALMSENGIEQCLKERGAAYE